MFCLSVCLSSNRPGFVPTRKISPGEMTFKKHGGQGASYFGAETMVT